MTTKTIIATDMQHAMNQAKKELGSDAIIVSSRRVGDEIEVTVTDDIRVLETLKPKFQRVSDEPSKPAAEEAVPQDDVYHERQANEQEPAERMVKEPASKEKAQLIEFPVENTAQNTAQYNHASSAPSPVNTDLPASPSRPPIEAMPSLASANSVQKMVDASRFSFEPMHDPALKKLLGELKSIGEFWNEFGVYWESHGDLFQYPWSKQLRDRIDYLHLSHDLRDRLVRDNKEISDFEKSWQLVLSRLQQQINISSSDIIRTGGAYAFVGPSGAGKTTTIGKIAAEYVLQHGAEEVGLITTDIFRIAAYEQLTTMGKILDVELEVVDAEQGGLVEALERFSSKSLVLVDTAGLRRNDKDLAQQLVQIRQQGQRLQTMLVLPANIQYQSMVDAMETYETDAYQGCIFTRLDECNSMGAAVSLLVNSGIPAAYLASGHTIPDDLAKANPLLIIEQLLSFACQEVDVSRVEAGRIAEKFNPEQGQQIDLI